MKKAQKVNTFGQNLIRKRIVVAFVVNGMKTMPALPLCSSQ